MRISTPGSGAPSVYRRFSRGASAVQPVIDGCSVDPKLRIVVMPSCSARSPTAAGTAEPPSPMAGISAPCRSAIEVGMVEQADEEVRRALPGRQAVLEHRREHPAGIPHVDEVHRLAPVHRQQQRGEHPDAVADRRADERRPARLAGLHRAGGSRRRWCDGSASPPSGRTSSPTCTRRARVVGVDGARARRSGRRRRGRRSGGSGPGSSPTTATHSRSGRSARIASRLATKSRWPNVSAVTSAFTRVRREDVRRPPSGRRSARSARRPRRGTRSRRTSPRPRASSGAGTRPRRRA